MSLEKNQACSGKILLILSNRELVDQGLAWITQGTEQQQRERAAGVKSHCSILAATTSGRAKETAKQGARDGNG